MLGNPFESREIWFLTGSQDLYGEDVLKQVAEQSQTVMGVLEDSPAIPVKLVWKPVLKERSQILDAILQANATEACVGVITWMHTFSPAKMWIHGLDALQKPMLLLNTQLEEHLPWDTIDMDYMNLNQSAHGDREFGFMAARLGVPRTVVVGHVSHEDVQEKVGSWARAAVGRAELRSMKLCRFGDNMRNVGVTDGDKVEAELQFGPAVNTWGVNDLVEVVDNVEQSAIDALLAEYEAEYELAPELRAGGERRESLEYAARLEAGLRQMLEAGGFTGFTTNFEDLGGLRQLPGLAVQRLMAEGYGFGAEGDWKTAVLVRLAKVIGYGREGGASLMEDYCYELGKGQEKILGAHMLEICPSLTKATPKVEIHPLGIGGREDPVRMVFDADCGPAMVISMVDMGSRFRMTLNEVTVVGPDKPMPKLPVASAVWEPAPSIQTATACWIYAGGAHHTCMTTNTTREEWEMFAEMTQNELVAIDESTTEASFKSQIRWNDLYYTLLKA
ncbi:L-arabinose isomerase [Trueperella sp. LYQ143]|uniref:L-arabinose isomerase n=1 Tax=unclassified Trueperella TaxID=2630174 RepID=UPI003983C1C3